MYCLFLFGQNFILLQGKIPDLGGTAINIVGWALVASVWIIFGLLVYIWKQKEKERKQFENYVSDKLDQFIKTSGSNQSRINQLENIAQRLDRNYQELHKYLWKDVEPRIRHVEKEVYKRNGQ